MTKSIRNVLCYLVLLTISVSTVHSLGTQHGAAATTIQLQPVLTSGLFSPVYVTNAHDGSNRLFVVEQPGRIVVLQPGQTSPTVFLDLTTKVQYAGEQGLLGLAFHPQFKSNHRFFVHYTRQSDGVNVIAEYRASPADPNIAETNETVILTIAQPFSNHNGGMIEFGADGFLYIAKGDGGSANDPGNRAQNVDELLGKMLRIDIDSPNGPLPYSSPVDNPFFGATPGRDEIYAYGLRNPWRFSFDRMTGQLYVGDVGQGALEEIDIVTRGSNYGWRVYEGNQCTNLSPPLCGAPGFTFPIAEYSHAAGRCSITGGYVYRGHISTFSAGTYVYADFCTGEIFSLEGGSQTLLLDTTLNISSFGEDEAGEIYVVALGGEVYRIVNPDAPCSFFVSPSSRASRASGGTGSLVITAPVNCSWTAASNDGFITINAGSNGTGTGAVNYSVAPNLSVGSRSGTVTAAGPPFTVNQSGASFFGSSVADFDGDNKGDITIFRPAGGNWWILNSSGALRIKQWGYPDDKLVPGDYDGDGETDIAVYRPSEGTWWIINSSNATIKVQQWGLTDDIPVPGDYDGDGKTDIAIFRPSDRTWWILNSASGTFRVQQWGAAGDQPAPADFDGDGRTDTATYRPSDGTWWIINSSTGAIRVQQWGLASDIPVPGDYDRDGKTDIAIYRPSDGTWWIIDSFTGTSRIQQWGRPGDIPVPGDYDGDGKTDTAIFRPSDRTWWILNSLSGTIKVQQWGLPDDIPVPSCLTQ